MILQRATNLGGDNTMEDLLNKPLVMEDDDDDFDDDEDDGFDDFDDEE